MRKLKRAQILLGGRRWRRRGVRLPAVGWAAQPYTGPSAVFVLGNLAAALNEEPRPGAARKLSGKEEALLVATACSNPPAGRARWTLEVVGGSTGQAYRTRTLSPAKPCAAGWPKTTSSRGARTCGAFRRWMANLSPVLEFCSTSMVGDAKRPVVCFDESPTQLRVEVRQSIQARPDQSRRRYELRVLNAIERPTYSLFLDVHPCWRKIKVTDSRTAASDFGVCMRDLTDVFFPKANFIRVVLDNLSDAPGDAPYRAFPPDEARRVLRRSG